MFCWTDLATEDQDGARRFYCQLMDWTSEEGMLPGNKRCHRLLHRDRLVAGICPTDAAGGPGERPPRWRSYITVRSAQQGVERARRLGGEVLAGPVDVARYGRVALLQDPAGARVALWEAGEHQGEELDGTGARCWTELHTPDPQRAGVFYAQLFGWGSRVVSLADENYTMFLVGDRPVGGMRAARAGDCAHWMVYFAVEDCAARARQADQLGAATLAPLADLPNVGQTVTLQDPQGAAFSLIQPAADA